MSTQTKYRIKTSKELATDYTTDDYGVYLVGKTWFNTRNMGHLYGIELTDSEACQILSLDKDNNVRLDLQNGPAGKDNHWLFTRGMIIEIKTTKKSYLKDMKETTQTISRKNLGLIHDVACSTWKSTIECWMKEQGVFLDEYTLTEEQVDKMFIASSDTQKTVLVKAGLKQSGPAKIDLTKSKFTSPSGLEIENPITINEGAWQMISLRYSANDKYDGSCYYLSSYFDWTIEQDGSATVLVPKYKK